MVVDKLPKLKINVEKMAIRAEAIPGALVYASSLPGTYMIRCDKEALIITSRKGYLRLQSEDIPSLIEELANIQEDMKR